MVVVVGAPGWVGGTGAPCGGLGEKGACVLLHEGRLTSAADPPKPSMLPCAPPRHPKPPSGPAQGRQLGGQALPGRPPPAPARLVVVAEALAGLAPGERGHEHHQLVGVGVQDGRELLLAENLGHRAGRQLRGLHARMGGWVERGYGG